MAAPEAKKQKLDSAAARLDPTTSWPSSTPAAAALAVPAGSSLPSTSRARRSASTGSTPRAR